MTEHHHDSNSEHDVAFRKARDELTEAIRNYVHVTDPRPVVVVSSTIVYETSFFDGTGDQVFNLGHAILDGSLMSALGCLDAAGSRLTDYVNRRDDD